MRLEEANVSLEPERPETDNVGERFLDGAWSGLRTQVDGTRQLLGDESAAPAYGNDPVESGGRAAAQAAIYAAATFAGSKIPVVGKLAPAATGATMGFLAPTYGEQGLDDRFKRGAIGAATALTFQHGAGALARLHVPSRTLRAGTAAAVAGAGAVQAESLLSGNGLANPLDTGASAAASTLAYGFLRAPGAWAVSNQSVDVGISKEKPGYQEPQKVNADQAGKLGEGDYRISLEDQGKQREYDIHIPKGYDGSKPLPVRVVLDGVNADTYGTMAKETQFNKYADENQVAVIYPYALKKEAVAGQQMHSWNMADTGVLARDSNYDDSKFLDAVMEDAGKRIKIDKQQVTGVGFSEGAMALQKYAAMHPGLFNGIASVHGAITGNEEYNMQSGEPAPDALVISGTGDYMLPYGGGHAAVTLPFESVDHAKPYYQSKFWADKHGATAAQTSSSPVFERIDYKMANGDAPVTEYIIKGGAHAWDGSGTGGLPLVGRPLRKDQFDTSAVVWDFLDKADKRGDEQTA